MAYDSQASPHSSGMPRLLSIEEDTRNRDSAHTINGDNGNKMEMSEDRPRRLIAGGDELKPERNTLNVTEAHPRHTSDKQNIKYELNWKSKLKR